MQAGSRGMILDAELYVGVLNNANATRLVIFVLPKIDNGSIEFLLRVKGDPLRAFAPMHGSYWFIWPIFQDRWALILRAKNQQKRGD